MSYLKRMNYKVILLILTCFVCLIAQSITIKQPTVTTKATYASFNAYIAAIGDTVKTLQIGNTYKVTNKLTLKSTTNIFSIINNAMLDGDSTDGFDTLVLPTGSFTARPTHQWIGNQLTVLFSHGAVSEVMVAWFGWSATNSAAQNDLAFRRAVASMPVGSKLIIPDGNYSIQNLVFNPKSSTDTYETESQLICRGRLIKSGTGTAVQIGDTTRAFWRLRVEGLYVARGDAAMDWTDSTVGIDFVNCYNGWFQTRYVYGFHFGIRFSGINTGCVYNQLHCGTLTNNRYGISARYSTSLGNGFSTENKIYGGDFSYSGILGTSTYPNPAVTNGSHVYLHGAASRVDHYVFYAPSFQGASAYFTSGDLKAVDINTPHHAIFSPRSEGGNGGIFKFGPLSEYNMLLSEYLYYGAGESPIEKVIDSGSHNHVLVGGAFNKIGIGAGVANGEGNGLLLHKTLSPTGSAADNFIMYADDHPVDSNAVCPWFFTEDNKKIKLCEMPATTDLKDLLDTLGLIVNGAETPLDLDGGELTCGVIKNVNVANKDSLSATELVTNGTFPSDVSGWTVENGATMVHSSGKANLTLATLSPLDRVLQAVTTELGAFYVFTVTVTNYTVGTSTVNLQLSNLKIGGGNLIFDLNGDKTYTAVVQGGSGTNAIEFRTRSAGTATAFTIDNVTLKKITRGDLNVAGIAKIKDTTSSTSSTTGALVVGGGLGVAGSAHFGGDSVVVGAGASKAALDTVNGLTLTGNATVWDDIRVVPGSFDSPGVSDPSLVAYGSTYLWEFQVNDSATFTVQMPHGYNPQDSIFMHVHWTPGTRGNEEGTATVGWKVGYTWAMIDSVFPAWNVVGLSDACKSTDGQHLMSPEVGIAGTGRMGSSMLLCNIKRTDTGTDDTWAGTASGSLPFLLEIGFHYPINRLGSATRNP